MATVEEIGNNVGGHWNNESRVMALGIKHSILSFQFVLSLILVSRCLEVTRPLTKQLQAVSLDASGAQKKVSLLNVMLQNLRLEIDENHNVWYNEDVTLAEEVGTVPAKPRTAGRQVHRRQCSYRVNK